MTKRKRETVKITDGAGDVFADLGLENSEELTAKAQLALVVNRFVRAEGLTQADAGRALGVSQAEISRLSRGELDRFSTEKLIDLAMRCGRDVEIVLKKRPASRRQSRLSVKAA